MKTKSFKDLSSTKQKEIMQTIRDDCKKLKENYNGSFQLRGGDDDYDIVANVLINDLNFITDKESFIYGRGSESLNINEYHSELVGKTPWGIDFTESYLDGLTFLKYDDEYKSYLSAKRKNRRKKQLQYIIAIGIVSLILWIILN